MPLDCRKVVHVFSPFFLAAVELRHNHTVLGFIISVVATKRVFILPYCSKLMDIVVSLFSPRSIQTRLRQVLNVQSPQQIDNYSCGWFTIHSGKQFFEWFAQGERVEHMVSYRGHDAPSGMICKFRHEMLQIVLENATPLP